MRELQFSGGLILFGYLILITACKKEEKITTQNPVADSSYISITNASPTLTNLALRINNQRISLPDSPLYYGKTTYTTYFDSYNSLIPIPKKVPYMNIPSGYQQLDFSAVAADISFARVSDYFVRGARYSVFITDTLNHGQLQCVVLADKIGRTDTTKSQIRFLNLSPDAPPLDIWAFPDVGFNGFKLFSNCAYLANDYDSRLKAESFSLINAGPYYFMAMETGTNNVLLEGGLIISGRTVISIYAKGFLAGSYDKRLDIGVIIYQQ